MAKLKGTVELNVSDYEKGIQKSINDALKFDGAMKKLGNSDAFKKIGVSASLLTKDIKGNTLAFSLFASDMSKSTNTVKSLIRQLLNAMANLSANGIDQASESYRKMQMELGRLMDIQADVAASGKVWGNDNARIQGAIQGVGALAAGYGALQSSMLLLGIENENVNQAMLKTMAITSLLNSVQTIQQAFNKDSILSLTILKPLRAAYNAAVAKSTAVTTTNTVALGAEKAAMSGTVVATGAATVAQRAFNIAVKANPYVLLASALVAVGAALYAFCRNTNDATEAERKLAREAEATRIKIENLKRALELLGLKTGDLLGDFKVLQAQWSQLKTVAELKAWIEANKSAFAALGISVNNVNDAYKVFVQNAPAVINALTKIAEAEAMKDLYKESIKKIATREKSVRTGDYYLKANRDNLTDEEKRKYGRKNTFINSAGGLSLITEYDFEAVNKERLKAALETKKQNEKIYLDEADSYKNKMIKASEEAEKAKLKAAVFSTGSPTTKKMVGSSGGSSRGSGTTSTRTTNTTSTKNAPTYEEGSIADVKAQIEAINKKLENLVLTQEEINDLVKKQIDLEVKLEKLQDARKPKAETNILSDVSGFQLQGAVSPTEGIDLSKLKIEIDYSEADAARAAINRLTDDLAGGAITASREFLAQWENANGTEKAVLVLEGLSNISGQLSDGFSLMALKSAEFAMAAKIAETASRSFAAAEAILAVIEAIKSASSLPFPANVIGIATASASAMSAIFSAMGAFETGGIVGGQDYHGDKRTVRVNSGEMILPKSTQLKLWNQINRGDIGGASGGQVEFKIKGRELVGVLNNFNNKTSKVL